MKKIFWKSAAALLLATGVFTFGSTGVGGWNGAVVQAADTLKSGNWEYELSGDSVTVTGYDGKDAVVTIPEKLGDYTVTEIGHSCMKNKKTITSVTIPKTITKISSYAFSGCSNLSNLYFNATNCTFGSYVFSGAGLTSGNLIVEFGEGVMAVPKDFFEFSGSENYPRVTEVKLSDSIKTIGSDAFKKCQDLKSITWGSGLEKIESDAFNGCTDLTALELPEKLSKIGHSAFREDAALTSITIPAGVKEIDGYAFSGCSNLSEIYYYAPNCTLGSYVFSGAGVTSGKIAVEFCDGVVNVPNDFSEYSGDENYPRITEVKLSDSVKTIGNRAFKKCKDLREITWGSGLEEIGADVFQNCTGLTSVVLPNKLNKIGYSAFRGNISLESVTIPESVTEIGGYAFEGCNNLGTVKCLAKNTSLGSYVFQNCTKVVIWCYKGSKIAEYAASEKYQISFLGQTAVSVPKVSVKKVTSGKKGFTLKWEKCSDINGYEIRYSLKSGMGGSKILTINASSTSHKVKKLKAKKKYFIQIRAYRVVDGKTVYGSWSVKKSIVTKK